MEKGEEPAPGAKIKIRGGAVDRRPPLRDSRFPDVEERPEKIIIEDEEVEILDIEIEWNGGKPKKEGPENTGSASAPSGHSSAPGSPEEKIAARPVPETSGSKTDQPGDPFGSAKDSVAGSDQVWHTVQRGETLWRISQQYGTTVDRLKALNQLDSNHIRSGMQLKVR
jgi:LysM repeat protein